jgi:hypothetical protein
VDIRQLAVFILNLGVKKISIKFAKEGNQMKKILFLVMAIFLVLSISGISFAASEFYEGTVMKISGDKITVKNNQGKVITVVGSLKGLKVGDKVTVNNGKITNLGNNSSIQLYKDGEDGVNRTGSGNKKPGNNSPAQPLYKDGEDGVNRKQPLK